MGTSSPAALPLGEDFLEYRCGTEEELLVDMQTKCAMWQIVQTMTLCVGSMIAQKFILFIILCGAIALAEHMHVVIKLYMYNYGSSAMAMGEQ